MLFSGFSGVIHWHLVKRLVLTLAISVSLFSLIRFPNTENLPEKEYFGLKGVLEQPSVGSSRIPALLFCIYQLMFAAITYVILLQILKAPVLNAAQSGSRCWWYSRTWPSWSPPCIHLRLEYTCLRSYCVLDLESRRLVVHSRWS
jgi:hypothetical protein